jgi:hypothetical protein
LERIVGVTAVADAGVADSGDDDEAGPFGTAHLEWRDVADAHADAGVGDLDLLRGDFVGDHHVMVGMCVGNQVEGEVTLRHNGRLHHIGVGAPYKGWRVIMFVAGLGIRIVGLDGSPLRHLKFDPTKDYQPIG